jgi:hypothetical protein
MLQARAMPGLDLLREAVAVAPAELEITQRFWIVPAAAARATPAGIARLESLPGVRRVWLDTPFPVAIPPSASVLVAPSFTSDAMRTIGADAVWPQGATGSGTTVALFDSGVDGTNAMLSRRWRGRRTGLRAAWFDPFRRASEPQDFVGHGTQVALAAVGALGTGDSLRLPDGTWIVASSGVDVVTGAAPAAEWIAARVLETLGSGIYSRRSVLLQAFQWALDPDGDPGTDDAPDVINNSWGIFSGTADFGTCEDPIYEAVDAAEAAGIAVLFAAGNGGPAAGSVSTPAARDDPGLRSFAVGSTTGTGDAVDVAEYSGRGPSPCNGGIKPELVAPGFVPEVLGLRPRAARLTGSGWTGTSFSVAQASGAVAVVRSLRPSATPEDAKRILIDAARDLPPAGPDDAAGYGLLDLAAAVSRASASFAGPLLQLRSVDRAPDALVLSIGNRGRAAWPGGTLTLSSRSLGRMAATAPAIAPDAALSVRVPLDREAGTATRQELSVRLVSASGEVALATRVLLAPPNVFGGFVLADGDLRVGANDFGRIGRIAAPQGLLWNGTDLLPAGALAVAAGSVLSDGIYVETLGQSDLKAQPPTAATDWAPSRGSTSVEADAATVRFDDFESLAPAGLELSVRYRASEVGGVGALTAVVTVRNRSGGALNEVTPALFADWDLPGGETVRWLDAGEALVSEPRSGAGPVALVAGDGTVRSAADVPLGTPTSGVYAAGSGVLAGTFEEADKLALVRGADGSGLPGAASATDRAALLSLGPFSLGTGAERTVRFWLLAATDEASALARLEELRAEPLEPPGTADRFRALPPFPNPFRVGEGVVTFPSEIPDRLRTAGAELVLEIYDVAGRRLFRSRHPVGPGSPSPVLTWDGRLADSAPVASGVYLYVLRLGDRTRSGRLIVAR